MIHEKPNNVNKHQFQNKENLFQHQGLANWSLLNSISIFGEVNFGSTTVPVHLSNNNNNNQKKKKKKEEKSIHK